MKSRIKNWLNKFNRKTRLWMTGRYGPDKLSLHICALSCIFMVVGTFFLRVAFAVVATALMIIAVARICSKNLERRAAELNSYERLLSRLRGWASLQKKEMAGAQNSQILQMQVRQNPARSKGQGQN